MDNKKKGLIGLASMIVVAAVVIFGSNSIMAAIQKAEQAKLEIKAGDLLDGTYHAEDAEFKDGYKGMVDLTVKDGAITSLVWENVDEEGNKKSELAAEGIYVMTETGLNWKEQSEALAQYVLAHQGTSGLNTNEEGKTDAVSGVSISIGGFLDLTNQCIQEAASGSYKDGTYHAENAEFKDGYKGTMDLTVKNGVITSLVWENVDEEGNKKSQLALEGKYVMTETGLNWKEQSEALAQYVLAHQGVSGLTTNEEGKTDAVSGVSISISEFLNLAQECLQQAQK